MAQGAAMDHAQADAILQHVQSTPSASTTPAFTAAQCHGIADLSTKSRPVFTQRDNGEWECSYMIEYKETGHTPSLFLQIRGTESGIWSNFRLKLNFGSLLSRQVLGARAANLVYLLVGTNTPVKDLDAVLASGRDLEMSFDGVTLKYKQERLDTNRFNLFGSRTPVVERKLPE
ncbi:hypothetical protein HRR99_16745 [Agrobacterium vaccinii]|uniref:DUF6030 family protein n=1 Tax=Agrobacterium vaccinii TaxID=2735528 RepID=UPI001E35001B|nr:DUF6030 family protein [Agrobacterium vaccinii]UHS63249.1 hypothetical protein HRR99_16745 [Agrobacterium vaccinii]